MLLIPLANWQRVVVGAWGLLSNSTYCENILSSSLVSVCLKPQHIARTEGKSHYKSLLKKTEIAKEKKKWTIIQTRKDVCGKVLELHMERKRVRFSIKRKNQQGYKNHIARSLEQICGKLETIKTGVTKKRQRITEYKKGIKEESRSTWKCEGCWKINTELKSCIAEF